MQTQLSRAAFKSALASLGSGEAEHEQGLSAILQDIAEQFCHEGLNDLLWIEWHEVDFDPILANWREALREAKDDPSVIPSIRSMALEPFLQDRWGDYEPHVRSELARFTYRRSTVLQHAKRIAAAGGPAPHEVITAVLEIVAQKFVDEAVTKSVPHGIYTEVCFVPNWDGESIDDMVDTCALRSTSWRLGYLDELLPCDQMRQALTFLNVSSAAFIRAVANVDAQAAKRMRVKWKGFRVTSDRRRPCVIAPEAFVSIILEAGTHTPVLMGHGEVEVATLLSWDPRTEMRWQINHKSTGKVSIGLHDVINGAGYLDLFEGELRIPPGATGFGWPSRWPYGIDKCCGLVKSSFRTSPTFHQLLSHRKERAS